MTVRSMRAAARRSDGVQGMTFRNEQIMAAAPTAGVPRPAIPAPALAMAREVYAARRRRERFLAADLFGEPTWDILLDLFIAAAEARRVPTTSACIGANVPPTTALRWLRILEARGLVEREDDGRDGRRTFVCLTARGLAAMTDLMLNWQAAMGAVAQSTLATDQPRPAPAFSFEMTAD
ncbi:DNA-binding MarR family transcriptional regulator [Novosphingobium sp. GV055]|nr:DNA-binding MarR family transcriptional regulator [Novosphingobium sp. GV055]PUB05591.1 DNA-binding MarR family transcriptional regulator [Novosphingobium sp. GV061]PUB21824.1 DNA-binding MarR family transcriptional regulator [Novosphingobium sp. GV079]PUB43597.1 DNA-binding MarR family transcriptional regulator [Novosphingobium sp. GV027]